MTPENSRSDRARRVPRSLLYLGLGVPLALISLAASPAGADFFYVMVGIPLLLLLWGLAACWSLILCIRLAIQRAWKSSFACAVLPITLFVASLYPASTLRGLNLAGDLLHFAVAYPRYERAVERLQPGGQPRIVVFNWGGMVWASRGVVYDESEEVALPSGRQSAAWLASSGLAELRYGGFSARPLWSHYYLVSFSC
jgi:hypothetical protein